MRAVDMAVASSHTGSVLISNSTVTGNGAHGYGRRRDIGLGNWSIATASSPET